MKTEGEAGQYLEFGFFLGKQLCVKENTLLKSVIKTKSVGKETLPEETPLKVQEIL